MDWLAGSRQHLLELLLTRTLILGPIFVLGFSKEIIDAYIVVVGFQAVFNHANVSVRPVGQEAFGERTEIKNINSFRFVERAINFEIERHIDVLESGGTIERETRLYDPDRDETRSMRG